jgi:NitT/TauT family transport system substrate-binding protein
MNIFSGFRNTISRIVIATLIISVVSACTRSKESPENGAAVKQAEKMTICQGGVLAVLPLIARNKGYFDKGGVDVSIINKGDGKLAMDALLAGDCTFAVCGEPPLVSNSFKRGDFAVLASISSNENATKIIARRDMGVATAQDLKGKTIGVRKGTLSHFFLDQFLKKNLIRSQEVNLRFMEPGALPDALDKGEIAAYSGADELIIAGRKKVGDKAIVLSEPGLCFTSLNLVARKEYIANHREAVNKLMKALIQAEEFVAQQPGEARELIQKEKGISMADLDIIFKDQVIRVTLQKALLFGLEDQARWMIEAKMTDRSSIPNYLELFDTVALMALKPSAVNINR